MKTRRHFLQTSALATGAAFLPAQSHAAGELGERPEQHPSVSVLNPRYRVPVSFIIDDSTCLVNMGYYCMSQFKEAWGRGKGNSRYDKPWKTWPREIPDSFVREFGEFCREQGVKGKYSVVPYPACVGWLDRTLPGWSHDELRASLALVRDFMMPDWDIHPEMISHTRVIDIKTGRPYPRKPDGGYWMENGGWEGERDLDRVASYIEYALQLLKNVDLPCEGFTTPGGFGNLDKQNLAFGGMQAVKSVFNPDVPHYFKYVVTGANASTQPKIECARKTGDNTWDCMVNIPSCTGDWFGSWDGGNPEPTDQAIDRHITADFQNGRMAEVIQKGEPACFLTHWPSLYANGTGIAYRAFQGIVKRVNEGYADRIQWMKLSEIARYWAAKELTEISRTKDGSIRLEAPFAAPNFTLRIENPPVGEPQAFKKQTIRKALQSGEWMRDDDGAVVMCFDLSKGETRISFA